MEEIDLPYSPKRATFVVIALAFTLGGLALGYVALTEPVVPWLVPFAAIIGLVMAVAFWAVLLRSKSWRLRVDRSGVSVDTLLGRRALAWTDIGSVEINGEGRTQGILVKGTNGKSVALNAMLMSDPTQLPRVHEVIRQRLDGT